MGGTVVGLSVSEVLVPLMSPQHRGADPMRGVTTGPFLWAVWPDARRPGAAIVVDAGYPRDRSIDRIGDPGRPPCSWTRHDRST